MAVEARVIDRNGQQVVVFPDGTEVPLARVQAAMAQRPAADGPQPPPRADAPMSVSTGPSYSFGDVGRGVGNEELSAAYDTLSNATSVGTYDPILAASRYAGNMGRAGLLGIVGAGKKAGALAAETIGAGTEMAFDALGIPQRWEKGGAAGALYRDMGAGIQAAGVGPEARMLDVLASAGAGRSAVDAADLTAREALAYARSVGEGDLAFLRGGGVPQSLGAASRVGNIDLAVSRGQGILDMLKSGRGADVTDEMLDMGDPVANARLNQYLYQNYDLPMDQASRMERAGEMGMGNDVMHGTPYADISALKPSEFGAVGSGVYVATNPKVAGDYARGYGFMTPQKTFEYNGERFTEGGNVMPLRTTENLQSFSDWTDARMADLKRQGLYGSSYKADDAASRAAADAGFDGVQARQGNAVIFDPASIRSRFARFDPRLSHLRNLSAAAAGTGLLGVGMQNRDRQEM